LRLTDNIKRTKTMAIEVTPGTKKIFTFRGKEYPSLAEFKTAALEWTLTVNGTDPNTHKLDTSIENILAQSEKVCEILRYAGRKPRTPHPPGWVAPPRKGRKAKKGAGAGRPEAAA
jgi:hypothetical protein